VTIAKIKRETLRVKDEEATKQECEDIKETDRQDPDILEEIEVEDFTVDGICGVY
jgi:mycofactocin precursor